MKYNARYRRSGETVWATLFEGLETPSFEWTLSDVNPGTYEISIQAVDDYGLASPWSYPAMYSVTSESGRFRDSLYEKIPESTRYRDELSAEDGKKAPMRQLVDVLSEGLRVVKGDIDGIFELLDADRCPDEYLPFLGGIFGFEFPYDLPADKQRNFLRAIVPLAMSKGTPSSIRLSALRIIGEGFDLIVKDEDYQAKTFTVEVTAEGTGATSQLEQKLNFMVEGYSPAGMIPSIVIIYYFAEVMDSTTFSDADHETQQYSSWRLNVAGHRLSSNMQVSAFGTTPLDI